jgi:hypothetical protein
MQELFFQSLILTKTLGSPFMADQNVIIRRCFWVVFLAPGLATKLHVHWAANSSKCLFRFLFSTRWLKPDGLSVLPYKDHPQ